MTPPCPFCGSTTTYTATDVVRCTACFNVLPAVEVKAKAKAVAPPEPATPAKQSAGVRSKKQAAPKPAKKHGS